MLTIITGLLLLGVVIIIHELGHFFAARLSGVTVETFSLGWGPVILRKKIGNTEYRISALPMGGYCGMKGEQGFREALEKNLKSIPSEKDSYYGVHPLKRIMISFSGPFANLLFAVIALTFVSSQGTSYQTYDNRIVPASAYENGIESPIDIAGLVEGDRILSLDGNKIETFYDLQQYIGTHPQKIISLMYEHNGQNYNTTITPVLDKDTGTGRIGVYQYIPLNVAGVKAGSAAETAGIKKGDVLIAVNGITVSHYIQLSQLLQNKPEQITVTIKRINIEKEINLLVLYNAEGVASTGIEWEMIHVTIDGKGFPDSIINGILETKKTIFLIFKSISLLFSGVNLTEAVSGPVRITMMMGEVAKTGLTSLAEFLSIICISLFIMNLLPIPVLDGGMILYSLAELLIRKPISPKLLYYGQFVGIFFILSIFLLSIFGDIKFLLK